MRREGWQRWLDGRLWAALTALCVSLTCPALGAERYVLGMSAAFTGPSRGLGIELYRGSAAYFKRLNAHGGINGKPVVILPMDDGYQPDPAVANTIRFMSDPDVLCLFNYVGTPTVTRILPLLTGRFSERRLLFFPFTGAEPQRQPPYAQYVFNLRASYRQELAGLVDRFVGLGATRAAVFYQADAYGRSGWDGTRRALARHGLPLAGEATYRRGVGYADSMEEQVEIIKRSKPDVVFSIGSYAACAAFIRDARKNGLDAPIANLSFVGSENMLALLTQETRQNGVDYLADLVVAQVVPSYDQVELPAVADYRALMDGAQSSLPAMADPDYAPLRYSFTSFEGYLNARTMEAVLRRYDASPGLGLAHAAESVMELNIGIGAAVSFGPDGRKGLDRVYYTTAVDGRFVPMSQEQWEAWRK